MQSTITTMAVIACCFLLYSNYSKTQQIKSLEVEMSWVQYESRKLKERIVNANEAVQAAAESRKAMYDEARRILGGEPDERDGAVAPALADTIGRLP